MTAEATALLRRLEGAGGRGYVPSYEIAKVYDALGRREETFQWLERAMDQRSHSLVFLAVDPQLAHLRGDPRFVRLRKRVGLEERVGEHAAVGGRSG